MVRGASAEWTILRASRLGRTFDERPSRGALLGGEVALAADEPFVDTDEVAALTEDGHAGRVYELSRSSVPGRRRQVKHPGRC